MEKVRQIEKSWKKIVISVSAGCLLAFGAFTAVDSITEQTVDASSIRKAEATSGVNFRTAPSTSSRVLGVIPRGTTIDVLEVTNSNWVKARVQGTTGYVSTKFLREVSSATSSSVQATSNVADRILATAQRQLGTPYQFGASTGQTRTFDCSSFTQYVFGQNGISLPRNSRQQSTVGQTITSRSQLQKGDLIFFRTGNRSDGAIDHVAIYAGNGRIVHAVPSRGVVVDNLSGFWLNTAVHAKRVIR